MKLIKHPKRILEYVRQFELEKILNDEMISELELCEFQSGEVVLEGGTPLDYYYFFLEGKLKVFQRQLNGRNLLIQFYNQFDTLGDVEILQDLDVTCTVSALETSYLFRVEAQQMKRFAENHVPYLKFIVNSLSVKLRHADENYAFNLLNPVKNRLASYILWHLQTGEGEVVLKESLLEISEFIGTTYRQLHRAFLSLEEERVVKRSVGRGLEVLDIERLRELAGEIYHLF